MFAHFWLLSPRRIDLRVDVRTILRNHARGAVRGLITRALVYIGMGVCASGCAWLPNAMPGTLLVSSSAATAATTAESTASPASAKTAALVVDISAPPALKAVLEKHLDLTRLAQVAQGESVTDTELSRLLDATPGQVRELLQTEGYFAPSVKITRSGIQAAQGTERVQLVLSPGPQTRIAKSHLEITGDLANEAHAGDAQAAATLNTWLAAWPLKDSRPFRNADWVDAKDQALTRLRALGYLSATLVRSGVDIDPEQHRAEVHLTLASGPVFKRGAVAVEGLKHQDPQIALNLLSLPQGTPLVESLLLDAQDRMQKSGLYERVAIVVDPNPLQAPSAPLTLQLSEMPLQQLTFGVGFSANTGPRLTAEHIHRRVLDRDATARNKLEWGKARQAWDGDLSTHHNEGLYRWVTGVGIERLVSSADTVLSQKLKWGRAQDSPRIDRFYFLEFDRSSRTTDLSRSESTAYSANMNWSWRDVDNPLLPTEGWTLALQTGAGSARASSGLSGGFGRAYARLTGYLPLGDRWYGQARLEAGQVVSPGGLEVPESLRFRAGGDDSVRGYGYRTLGPTVDGVVGSGNALLTASVELARPIVDSMPQLWGAMFVDAGNATENFKDYKPYVGSGVGLRWRSPVGPLRLDLAWAHQLRHARLHFSVGIVF
jgi:translocation and assembly module TamA